MIKLIDLLLLCNDSMTVNIFNNECEKISCYDGRDSIEEELNHKWVEWIYPVAENVINIGITC